MEKKHTAIKSVTELRRVVPALLEAFNRDPQVAALATVNPLLALEVLGYDISPTIQKRIERAILFLPKEREQLEKLEQEIHKLLGRSFDLDSPGELETVIFHELRLKRHPAQEKAAPLRKIVGSRFAALGKGETWTDPLQPLENAHPIMKLLLAYRALRATRPTFAARQVFEQYLTGQRKLPVKRVKLDISKARLHHEEAHNA